MNGVIIQDWIPSKMSALWVLCGVLCCGIAIVESGDDMGPGIWYLDYINKCEEANHVFKFDVSKNMINRTHDGYDATLTLDEDFTDSFAIRVVLFKKVDGGYKEYQVLTDQSFINFVKKFADGNVKECLEMAGVEGADFPIKAGKYHVKDFIFNYKELPPNGPYGEYSATCYLLRGTQVVGCVEAFVEFMEEDE